MKILYVGKFTYPHSTENYVTFALQQLGCEVVQFPAHNTYRIFAMEFDRVKPDVVLFSKPDPHRGGEYWGTRALNLCRSKSVLTVTWQWDLWFGFRQIDLPQHFRSDLLFTTDGGHQKEFENAGCRHAVLRQGIHKPEAIPFDYLYKWDVGFVGSVEKHHPSRTRLVNLLKATYQDRFILIQDKRGYELNKVLSQIKVIVGDSFPSSNYWSNRIYEITGRAGFLLHPHTEGLGEEYVNGVEYLAYERDNPDDVLEKITWMLSNETIREKIRLAGYTKTATQYTYAHRTAQLLKQIKTALAKGL